MASIMFNLDKELKIKIKKLCIEQNITMTKYINQLIKKDLEKK